MRESFEPEKLNDQQKIRHVKRIICDWQVWILILFAGVADNVSEISEITRNQASYLGKLTIHTRVLSRRKHGKILFVDLFSGVNKIQVLFSDENTKVLFTEVY